MNLLAWPITLLCLAGMYPYARWLLHRAEGRAMMPDYNPILLILTTLALSTGTISLLMLALGLTGLTIDWRIVLVVYVLICIIGFFLRDKSYLLHEPHNIPVPPQPLHNLARAAWLLILFICALLLLNAALWPFWIDDAVTLYAGQGKAIAQSGKLLVGTLYETYPMLVQLNYAFVFQMSGWVNEYLAALIPAMLSVGVVGAAYLLGRELYNHAAGLIAAWLIVLAPMFTNWASSGYVDLPAGFFYGMSILFLVRLDRTRQWPDALLAGIMAGLAVWTKNSALLLLPSVALWIVYRWWFARQHRVKILKANHLLLLIIGFVTVAGAWYTRNLSMAGVLVPPTGWTHLASRTVSNLFPYIVDRRYSFVGWIFTAGLVYTVWRLWQSRGRDSQPVFLLIFTVPFFAIWWLLFSYDGRFLLALTAPIAVMGAALIQEVWRRLPTLPRMIWMKYTVPFLILAALPAIIAAVDFKLDLIRHPFMSDIEKHQLVLGKDRYDMARYLSTLPAGSRILTHDLLLPFHADNVQMTVGNFPEPEQLAGYDYWVLSPAQVLPEWFPSTEPVHVQGEYRLYKLEKQ